MDLKATNADFGSSADEGRMREDLTPSPAAPTSPSDSEMLDWMQTHGDKVKCYATYWFVSDGKGTRDLRSAIRAAMEKDKQP